MAGTALPKACPVVGGRHECLSFLSPSSYLGCECDAWSSSSPLGPPVKLGRETTPQGMEQRDGRVIASLGHGGVPSPGLPASLTASLTRQRGEHPPL